MAEISIIIPAYNQSRYIADAIQSVYNQTFTDWELLIVDDGSTDDTFQVLTGFKDPRIRILRQANKGVSAARNTGVRNSSAPRISFLDADDLFLPDTLAILYEYLRDHPEVGFVTGARQRVDSSGQLYGVNTITPICLDFPGFLFVNDVPLGGVMIRREWWERVGGFDETMHTCEDWDVWLRLKIAGCQLSQVEQVVLAYRIHPGQVTGDAAKMRIDTLGLWEKFFNLPDLPSDLLAYRDLTIAAALVRTSARAFRSGEFEMGVQDLMQAVKLDPTLGDSSYKRLADLYRGWAVDPQTSDPEAYLLAISAHLPSSLFRLRLQLRRVLAALILESFFGTSRYVWRSRSRALIRALSYDPSWLANRGVLRMILAALFTIPPKRVM